MTTRAIRTITLYPEYVTFEYVEPEKDLTSNGLILNHALTIPCTTEYEDGIQHLVSAALDLLDDALEDYAQVPKLADVVRREEDEDEVSPWDNPNEREGVQP